MNDQALYLLEEYKVLREVPHRREGALLRLLEALAAENAALRERLDAIEHARQQEAYAAMGDDL